ncbi:acyltransferase family protein [Rhodococcus sp. 3Y1]
MHRINDGTIEPKSGDTAAHTGRVDWVDLAKGISIALVVLLHSTNFLVTRGLAAGIWNDINAVAEPIRMPLFFLTAGLFAHKVTSLPWATVIRRRVLPLAYLYLMWTVLRFVFFSAFPATAGTDETSSPLNLITALVVPTSGLWFLYALAVYTVLTKHSAESTIESNCSVRSRWPSPLPASEASTGPGET